MFCADSMRKRMIMMVAIAVMVTMASVCAWGQMRPVVVDNTIGKERSIEKESKEGNNIGKERENKEGSIAGKDRIIGEVEDSGAIVVKMPDLAVTDSMFGVTPKQQNINSSEQKDDSSLGEKDGSSSEQESSGSSGQEDRSFSGQADVSLLEKVEGWYSENMNYGSITVLMTIESSFIPFPSEVVIPPAAYVCGNEGSGLHVSGKYAVNVLLVVLFGTIGAILGAIINYLLALWLGRPIVYAFADSKIGHVLLLSSEKIGKAEKYFNDHGKVSTFIGRLIPGIRQLISIPAGLARMPFGWFLLYTFLGAFLWNSVLALLGYIAHGQMDLIHQYSHELSIVILALLGAVVVYFVVRAIIRKRKSRC